jgi:hypothetical protein
MAITITTYRSDGSDGYSEGTYGCVVADGRAASGDGGWPSRELAQEAGERLARSLSDSGAFCEDPTS